MATHDAKFLRVDFNASGERAEVIAAAAAALGPHPLAGRPGKGLDRLGGDGWPQSFYRALGPLSIGSGLIADRFQCGIAILQHQVGKIGDAVLNGVVEPLELGVCLVAG